MDSPPEFLRAKYESVELIGEGGDGRVYKCKRGERVTAVKTLVALDLASQTRFLSEANVLLQIDHENIVKVFEAGETNGCFWYESEHANEGHFGTMHGYILRSDLDRVNYFAQICLHINIGRELENALGTFFTCDSNNVLERLALNLRGTLVNSEQRDEAIRQRPTPT